MWSRLTKYLEFYFGKFNESRVFTLIYRNTVVMTQSEIASFDMNNEQ